MFTASPTPWEQMLQDLSVGEAPARRAWDMAAREKRLCIHTHFVPLHIYIHISLCVFDSMQVNNLVGAGIVALPGVFQRGTKQQQ